MIRPTTNYSPCEWVHVRSTYEDLQCRLEALIAECAPCGDRKLADFVRMSDRFLPLSVLDRTLAEATRIPFEQVRRTPGVGLVKIHKLLELWRRILDLGVGTLASSHCAATGSALTEGDALAIDTNEHEWSAWCERIRRHSLGGEMLGRVVERLSELSRSLWHVRLDFYTERALRDLRGLKCYGVRRIGVVVRTFRRLNDLLAAAEASRTAPVLGPDVVVGADSWMIDAVLGRFTPTSAAFRSHVALPSLELLRADLGDAAAEIVAERMQLAGAGVELGECGDARWSQRLSSSRIHQIRQDAAAALRVRWPRGEDLAAALAGRLRTSGDGEDTLALLRLLPELFPGIKSRLAPASAPPIRVASNRSRDLAFDAGIA